MGGGVGGGGLDGGGGGPASRAAAGCFGCGAGVRGPRVLKKATRAMTGNATAIIPNRLRGFLATSAVSRRGVLVDVVIAGAAARPTSESRRSLLRSTSRSDAVRYRRLRSLSSNL